MNHLQMGLFFDESTIEVALSDSVSWTIPQFGRSQYEDLITTARANLFTLTDDMRPFFQSGLEACIQSLAQPLQGLACSVHWRAVAHFDDQAWADLNSLSVSHVSHGVERKTRIAPRSKVIGFYAEHVGSIIVHGWLGAGAGRYWAEFLPWRSCFFLPSFRDNVTVIQLPSPLWENAVCCNHFATAGDNAPSVPTVKNGGREYVVTSGVFSREYREGEAWAFVRSCEWKGASFTYDQSIKEMDAGRLERGDRRGTLAKVRGELCVLSEMVILADNSAL
jgi:hypothetical protein